MFSRQMLKQYYQKRGFNFDIRNLFGKINRFKNYFQNSLQMESTNESKHASKALTKIRLFYMVISWEKVEHIIPI